MAYKSLLPIAGVDGLNFAFVPDTTQRFAMGAIVSAVDPYWGGGEFEYVYINDTVLQGSLLSIVSTFDSTNLRWRREAKLAASTTLKGSSLAVALAAATAGKYAWVQIAGLVPVACNASVAADTTFAVAATGQGGALAAGKQVVNGRVAVASTATVVKVAQGGVSGGTTIQVTNSDGWFVGMALTGTGIGASSLISAISQDGKTITVSVANSATVTGNITGTYNDGTIHYNICELNRPFQQGAIT